MVSLRDTLSRTQQTLRTRFTDRRFLLRAGLPLLFFLGVVAHGLWTYAMVEDAAKQSVQGELVALRDSVSTSLRIWLKQQETFAEVIAGQPSVVAAAQALHNLYANGATPAQLAAAEAQEELKSIFGEVLTERGYVRFRIVAFDGTVLSSNLAELIGTQATIAAQPELIEKIKAGKAAVSRPFKDVVTDASEATGEVRKQEAAILVLAPIQNVGEQPFAALSFQLRPDQEFSRILNATRSRQTTEAYAFDEQGLFLSASRFDEKLRQLGLIPPDGTSILTLEVRDPGADLTKGGRPTLGKYQQPFTKLVTAAIRSEPGVLLDAYSDYRGVPTVGAWSWLSDYGLGIAIEQDAAEAYAPLERLRFAFGTVFALLVLTGIGGIVALYIIAAQQRKLRESVRASRKLGHYTLEEKLGEGGMGEVYRGSHALLRRPVAIKLLKPEFSGDRALARFEREVQTTSRLQHPNTIGVFDFGRTPEGVFYYVMEFLEGISLEHLVRKQGPQPVARVIHIMSQVCGSLEEAHQQGLIHRDIKPANIMLCRRHGQNDVAKVLDFGLVKDVGSGEQGQTLSEGITGTPLYLAPEAIQSPDQVGPGRDIYAIGAVGYFLLTAKPPFEGKSLLDLCHAHIHAEVSAPSARIGRKIDEDLEAIVLKCMAKKPEDRFASVMELADALRPLAVRHPWSRADAKQAWKGLDSPADDKDSAPTPYSNQVDATIEFQRNR